MSDIYADFIEAFPEFREVPESRVHMFLANALAAVADGRFGAETMFGRFLHAAHHLAVLGSGAEGDRNTGAAPVGAVTSKSVGSVSVGYDVSGSSETEAGYWNSTGYGRLFWGLVRRYRRMPFVVVGRSEWP